MKFTQTELSEATTEGGSKFITIKREPYDQDRWHTYYEWIFEVDGHIYGTTYKQGSTEMQEADDPFGFDGAETLELEELFETPVTVYQYLTQSEIDKLKQQ